MIRSCLSMLLVLALFPSAPAEASNVEEELVVGIQSSRTMSIRPLSPVERDMLNVYDLVYDSLVVINDDYQPEFSLADNIVANGKTWTVTLRENVRFSDGTPLTAYDVKATIDAILAMAKDEEAADKGYYYNLRYFVKDCAVKNDLTLTITAERGYYGMWYALTFPVLPAAQVSSDNPPGTGPYMISDFTPGTILELVPNPNWWNGQPQVKNITFDLHQKASEVIESYEYARVDTIFTRAIASAQYKGGTTSLALDYRTNQLECLLMNHSAFPTNNQNVRMAIRYLIDVDKIATQIYSGMVERTDTPFINGTWMYNGGLSSYFRVDPAKALELLDEEGWSDTNDDGILDRPNDEGESVKLSMELIVYEEPDNDVRLETANLIADTLNSYGFEVSVNTVSFAEAQSKLKNGNFDLCLASYAMDVCPDAGFMLMNYNTGNYCRYKSEQMNDLCNELRKQSSQADFQRVLYQIQEQFAKDCPFVCMFYRSGTVLTRRMYTTVRDVREGELLKGIESFRDY